MVDNKDDMELDLEDIGADTGEESSVESKERVCPKCGSHHVASILYGMPAFSEDLQRELDEGKMVLGGCDIDIYHPMPNYRCNDCGYEFRYVA